MDLQLVRFGQIDFCQKATNIISLVSLQLYDFAVFWVLYNCAITGEFFFARLDNFFFIIIVADTLYSGQRLTPAPLLNSNMN